MAHSLVVEDDTPLRRIFTVYLVRCGHSVGEADSVAMAMETLRVVNTPFDVLLLDINPRWQRVDVLRQLSLGSGSPLPRAIVMAAMC